MKIIGKVLNVFSATKESSGLPRPVVKEINLIKDFGIQNDKFAGKKLDQTVMMVGLKSYEIALDIGIDLEIGSLGENILLDIDPHAYEIGDRFKFGDAVIEITQICTVCSHLAVFSEQLPGLLKGHRGVYCKIINDGIIKKDMKIERIYDV